MECQCPCHYTRGACFCTCGKPCPCHPDDGFHMCLNGAVYGPCGDENCTGVCTDTDDCEMPEGCCALSLPAGKLEETRQETR